MNEMRREVTSGDPSLDRTIADMLDGATILLRNGQIVRCKNEGEGVIFFKPLPIGEPTKAPSVAQLMCDVNDALGNGELTAEPVSPHAVWQRLMQQIRDRSLAVGRDS